MTTAEAPADSSAPAPRGYRPIEDYALIGDCHGAALVARDGSIDWALLDRFDADPVCCRLLDAARGGCWSLRPAGESRSSRAYVGDTALLRTEFSTAGGRVAVTDFMPVGRRPDNGAHDYVRLNAPGWIVRRVEGLQGRVTMRTKYRPSREFAARPVQLVAGTGRVDAGPEMPVLFTGGLALVVDGDCAGAEWEVAAGQRLDLVLAGNFIAGVSPLDRVEEFEAVTRAFWQEWIAYCRYRGPFESAVRRSALTLKLLTYAPTGAIVAAPTTSLPESIGGQRNWDYRYCWVRDSSFALYALAVLGYNGEAGCFHDFLLRAATRSLPEVRPLYGIDGALKLDEATLPHLEGYRGSAPVRTGNGAYLQRQSDVYGQVLDLSLLYQALGGKLGPGYRGLLRAVAAFIRLHAHEPDQGIWEMRGPPRHHVHGKLMSWVGLNRAGKLFGDDWQALADTLAREIRHDGMAEGVLRQAYDGGIDAAVLLAPMLGFELPEGGLQATIAAVRRELGRGRDFVARYEGEDGLPGGEGAFLVCTSWLIDAELAAGNLQVAQDMVQRLVACANDLGLYAEEVDAGSGAALGNFPQALTHLGLIGNVVNLQLAQRGGAKAVRGSYADRARRAVGATFGWRGLLAAVWQSRRQIRLRSSRASRLAWP